MPKTNTTPTTTDPAEIRALEIVAAWKAKEDRERMDRALELARMEVDAETTRKHDADPANWAHRMAEAGCTSVALTWPGAPVAPSLCLPPGLWSIDEKGVWFRPEDHQRQFVVSPVVPGPGLHDFSASNNGDWSTITVPPPEAPGGRVTPQAYVALVMDRLRQAGVTFGRPIDCSTRDVSDVVDPAHFVAIWVFGSGHDGSIVGRPTRTLAAALDERRAEAGAGYPDGVADREQLGGVLGRMPADVR